jgi:hypothetical protein
MLGTNMRRFVVSVMLPLTAANGRSRNSTAATVTIFSRESLPSTSSGAMADT